MEEDGGTHTQKPKIDTNYCRGTMRYQDVRMGDFKDDFKDGQLELTSNGAKLMKNSFQGALQRALFDQFREANAASSARARG